MASVKENLKDGKIFSYKFTACLGRDQRGKQIRKYKTWYPPTGLSKTRLRKLAQKEADKWEDQLFADLNNALQSTEPTRAKDTKNDFVQFAMNWFNTQVVNSSRKPKTIDCYEGILRALTPYFKGYKLEDIAIISNCSTNWNLVNTFVISSQLQWVGRTLFLRGTSIPLRYIRLP